MADGQGVDAGKVHEVLSRALPILAELDDAANQGAALSDLVATWLAALPPSHVAVAMNALIEGAMNLYPKRCAELQHRQADQRRTAH